MRRRPYTRRRKTVLGRIGTQERDQFSDATDRDRRVDRKCGRKAHSERDWFKILTRIATPGFIQYRINNVVIRRKQQFVAIRSRLRHTAGADIAARTAAIFHVKLLTKMR